MFYFVFVLDGVGEVWPDKLSVTTGIGEEAELSVSTDASTDTSKLRWRHNGGDVITKWNGMTTVTVTNVRKSDEGIYECHVDGNRDNGHHAIMRLIIRGTSCNSI